MDNHLSDKCIFIEQYIYAPINQRHQVNMKMDTNTQKEWSWETQGNLHMITKHCRIHLHSKQRPNAEDCKADIVLTHT